MTSAKTSLLKRLRFFSDFVAVTPTRPCHFSVNFPGIEFLETNAKFKKEKEKFVVLSLRPP